MQQLCLEQISQSFSSWKNLIIFLTGISHIFVSPFSLLLETSGEKECFPKKDK